MITPDYRKDLIVLVKEFLLAAVKLEGINRIAMIGSLVTNKIHLKGADILCYVDDNVDLGQLAKISRRLQGKALALGIGADIFLADTNNYYIGRICIWKECRDGIRQSCDALHCGRREYLHDDLQVIKLSKELIDNPPLVLYPSIIRNVDSPLILRNFYFLVLNKS